MPLWCFGRLVQRGHLFKIFPFLCLFALVTCYFACLDLFTLLLVGNGIDVMLQLSINNARLPITVFVMRNHHTFDFVNYIFAKTILYKLTSVITMT